MKVEYAMQYNCASYSLGSSLFQRIFKQLKETHQHTWPSGHGAFDQFSVLPVLIWQDF